MRVGCSWNEVSDPSAAPADRIVAYGSDWVKWLLPVIGQERFLKQVSNVKTGVGVGRKCFRVGVSLREVDTISKTQEVGFPRVMKITAHRCRL
jgi:hypothetical protein